MVFPSFRAIHADDLKGMISYVGFSEASTDVPATASTPGRDCLASLFRLAKP
jgi:hypothetical protein